MPFLDLKLFFRDHVVWLSGYELYWYELMWETISSHKIPNTEMEESKQESFLLAIALVDFYREFVQHAQDEYWYEAQELNIINLEGCDYGKICYLLNISPPTIHDFYSEEELLIERWDEENIQRVLLEERASIEELYFEYGAEKYRQRLLSVIKQKYDLVGLFSLMTNTFASDRYSRHRYLEGGDYIEVLIEDVESFVSSANSNQDDFLNDIDFIRGFEWLSMVFKK